MTLVELLAGLKFPKTETPYAMNFSVIKSDIGLSIPQHAHTDSAIAYSYGKRGGKKYDFSMLIGIEHHSFLDILLEGQNNAQRVLYERGDIFFVRNDIPHRGCENIGDFEHHRVHVLVVPHNLQDSNSSKT